MTADRAIRGNRPTSRRMPGWLIAAALVLLALGAGLALYAGLLGGPAPDSGAGPDATAEEIPVTGVVGFPARFFNGTGAIRGRLLAHPGGEAVAGVRVAVRGQPPRSARSGPLGRFSLHGVPAGLDLQLQIEAPGGAPRIVSGVTVEPEATADVGTLWLGGSLAWSGVVRDSQGRGVAGAVVTLHESFQADFKAASPAALGLHRRPPARARVVTGADGSYHLEAVARGPVVLVVRAPGHAPARSRVNLALAETHAGVYHHETQLRAGFPVDGIVFGKDGEPLADAAVVVLADFSSGTSALTARHVVTGADGRFQLTTAASATERLFVFAGTTFFAWGEPLGLGLEIHLR